MRLALLSIILFLAPGSGFAQTLRLVDAYPDKARFAPSEPVVLAVELSRKPDSSATLSATIWQLGKAVGDCPAIQLAPGADSHESLRCAVPADDFQGYLVSVALTDRSGHLLSERHTAIDISSDWKRFPRYGYLAHYHTSEGTEPGIWIDELNRYHITGLEFYDFQYRHDQPLAGTVEHPAASWKDIAGRTIDGSTVRSLIEEAHHRNMMAMAYNASYSAYDDVFTRAKDRFPLQWGIWDTPDGERSPATAKNLHLQATDWSTKYLTYMNPSNPEWQRHLFKEMDDLFKVYPFDGWHIDTFGEKGGFAYDGSRVNFIASLPSFVDHASAALHKPVVINTVNTYGEDYVARSRAEFVHSELWDDHETFASILETVEQVRLANPRIGFVIAAYVNRRDAQDRANLPTKQFNLHSVLLTDAAIFASGADHIELGDGDRMLSSEYFPADTCTLVSPALRDALRPYYDFLTAYENTLRYEIAPAHVAIKVDGQTTDPLAVPNTLWTIAHRKGPLTTVHFINLLGSDDAHWRDLEFDRPEPPLLKTLHVEIAAPEVIGSVGWASPDVDGGEFHSIPFTTRQDGPIVWTQFTLPELHYWDTVFLAQ
jgi:dextranase